MGKTRVTKARVKEAMHAKKGAVYLVAASLGVSHTTIYKYMERWPEIAAIKDHYDGEMVDIAELGLRDAVDAAAPWAIKYTLSTKGKGRGYTERQEITGADGGPVVIVDWESDADHES